MAVWTLKMNIIDKTDVFEFCKSENIIGFGWGLPDKNNKNNDAIMTITDYQKIKDRHGLYEKSRHLTACINAFKSMKDKDLIWTLDESKNIYYLCKTTGEYKHLKEEYSSTYGIANCMKVFGYHPISENLVPSEVKRLLHSSGIIYRLDDEKYKNQVEATCSLYTAIEKLN